VSGKGTGRSPRESEEKYRLLYETIKDGILFVDMDGRIIECNPACASMFGYAEDELKGLPYEQLESERWRQMEDEIFMKRILSTGYSGLHERDYVRKDGAVFPASVRTWLMKDKDGKPRGIWRMIRDITERRRMEASLRESEERYRTLVENAHDGIMIVNRDRKIEFANGRMHEMLGYRDGELIGKEYLSFISRGEVEDFVERTRRVEELGERAIYERWLIKKDGREIPTLLTVSPRHGTEGEFLGIQSLYTDITDLKRAEEEIRESEVRYSGLVNLAPNAIVVFDLEGRIVSCNPATVKISGYSDGEIVGKHFSSLPFLRARDIQFCTEVYDALKRGEMPELFELAYERKDGNSGWVEVSLSLLREGNKIIGAQAVARDITVRKQLEGQEHFLRSLLVHDLGDKLQDAQGLSELLGNIGLSGKPQESVERLRELHREMADLVDRARFLRKAAEVE
jgi:PAS domain S-box-containing protein